MRYIAIIALIIIDQFTKYLTVTNLKLSESINAIPNIFRFTYVENRGAAFGVLQDSRWFFIIVTITFVIGAGIYYEKNIRKLNDKWYQLIYILILSGAIGNFIDRASKGFVVDFIDFYTINYPVFNMADIYVCVGCGILAIRMLKREDGKIES